MPSIRLLVLSVMLMTCVAAEDDLDRVLTRGAQAQTATCRFDQYTHLRSEATTAGTHFKGTLYLAKPNRYDLSYTNPGDQDWLRRVLSDGTSTWQVEYFDIKEQPDVISGSVAAGDDGFARRLTDLLRFDRAVLEKDFAVETKPREGGGVVVLMTPRDPEQATRVSALEMDLDGEGRITGLRLDEPGGNRVTIVVSEFVFDAEQPAGLYTWASP